MDWGPSYENKQTNKQTNEEKQYIIDTDWHFFKGHKFSTMLLNTKDNETSWLVDKTLSSTGKGKFLLSVLINDYSQISLTQVVESFCTRSLHIVSFLVEIFGLLVLPLSKHTVAFVY